jgi:hypothetical protein
MPVKKSQAASRRAPRDETPLLALTEASQSRNIPQHRDKNHNDDGSNSTSSSWANKKRNGAGGLRRLFGGKANKAAELSSTRTTQSQPAAKRTLDVRRLPALASSRGAENTGSVATPTINSPNSNTHSNRPHNRKGSISTAQHHPQRHVLAPNVKDSSKKNRPFPALLWHNPRAVDPPAHGDADDAALEDVTSTHTDVFADEKTDDTSSQAVATTPADTLDASFSLTGESHASWGDASVQQPLHKLSSPTPRSPSHVASCSAPRTTDQQYTSSATKQSLDPVKALLCREFGKYPFHSTNPWVVEVSPAEWDEVVWKYRVLVQRRNLVQSSAEPEPSECQTAQSFTTAFTWRDLSDFAWLEASLRNEYHGALLIPLLNLKLGQAVVDPHTPVEPEPLRSWLSDVLNGTRGNGEWRLSFDSGSTVPLSDHEENLQINILESESMETFLYHAASPLQSLSTVDGPAIPLPSRSAEPQSESILQSFWSAVPLGSFCGVNEMEPNHSDPTLSSPSRSVTSNLPLSVLNCSSRALSSAPSLDIMDSFADNASSVASPKYSSTMAIHSESIEAERTLILNYRQIALHATERLQILLDEEERLGTAWKRLAVAIARLFTYEKDVETTKLGELKIKRENMPYCGIDKNAVDEALRALSRQKTDRAVPALKQVQGMLASYLADLSAVDPSLDAYTSAIVQLTSLEQGQQQSEQRVEPRASSIRWEEKVRLKVDDVKRQAMRSLHTSTAPTSPKPRMDHPTETVFQRRAQQVKLQGDERVLRYTLTTFCQATPLRTARMAWRYWNTEATQCALLNSAAISLRSTCNNVSKDAVLDMTSRHKMQEKEDNKNELNLLHRLLNIGVNSRKFPRQRDGDSLIDGGCRIEDEDDPREVKKDIRRVQALRIAGGRLGKWNAELALAIIEAVGVDDPNIRVEETTKDLRLIRKYAIGLRENLNRCVEAVELLKESMTGAKPVQGNAVEGNGGLRESRDAFLTEISKLFSGSFVDIENVAKSSSPSIALLSRLSVDTSDPLNWKACFQAESIGPKHDLMGDRVGDFALAYAKLKDSQTDRLLMILSDLLHDYYGRVEIVESFVYMECVGIQLEKYFSQKRTQTLTMFEKRTDITSAINVATRKQLPQLAKDLREKLDVLGKEVTHTTVMETKEAHLLSKSLKVELHELALRRLIRAREASTELVISLIINWAKENESSAAMELRTLGKAMAALEKAVGNGDIVLPGHLSARRSTPGTS